MDAFHDLGALVESTRETAFARRNAVRDRTCADTFKRLAREQRISGVAGFCLDGLYMFEPARRGLPVDLVGLYGFPQGLANDDPLPVPFDYLASLPHRHAAPFEDRDLSQPPENLQRPGEIARRNSDFALHVLPGSGHGFLADLDSEDPARAENARLALKIVEATLFAQPANAAA